MEAADQKNPISHRSIQFQVVYFASEAGKMHQFTNHQIF
jgi:hypothetical protein